MAEEFAEQPAVEGEMGPVFAEPATTADGLLADKVVKAIWDYYPIRATAREVRAYVAGGTVTLSGVVRTDAQKLITAEKVARIEGVREVRNKLASDDEIARAVAQALASDARTAGQAMLVRSMHGEVRLVGKQADAALADVAASVARQVPGVTGVVCELAGDGASGR